MLNADSDAASEIQRRGRRLADLHGARQLAWRDIRPTRYSPRGACGSCWGARAQSWWSDYPSKFRFACVPRSMRRQLFSIKPFGSPGFTGHRSRIDFCRLFLSLGPLNVAADSPLASALALMQDELTIQLLKSSTQIWVCVSIITRKKTLSTQIWVCWVDGCQPLCQWKRNDIIFIFRYKKAKFLSQTVVSTYIQMVDSGSGRMFDPPLRGSMRVAWRTPPFLALSGVPPPHSGQCHSR